MLDRTQKTNLFRKLKTRKFRIRTENMSAFFLFFNNSVKFFISSSKVDGFGTGAYGQATKDSDVYNDLIKRSRAGRFLRAIHTDHRIIR